MATGRFVHNSKGGLITDNPLTSGATTFNSPGLEFVPAVAAPATMVVVWDPEGVGGTPELGLITVHTASATVATVTRGLETTLGGSAARSHVAGTPWIVPGVTAGDYDQLPFRLMTTTGDILYAPSANVAQRLAVGAAGTVLHGGTTPSYGQVVTADIADKAVTGPKMLPAVCQVRMSAAQSVISNAAATPILFDTEDLDPLGWHSTASNTDRITPTIAGWYRVSGYGDWLSDADYSIFLIALEKNDVGLTPVSARRDDSNNVSRYSSFTSFMVQMNGTTDHFRMVVFQANASAAANTIRCILLAELVYPT